MSPDSIFLFNETTIKLAINDYNTVTLFLNVVSSQCLLTVKICVNKHVNLAQNREVLES